MLDAIRHHATDVALLLLALPIDPAESFFLGYVLSSIGLGYLSYRLYHSRSRRGFFRFLFPKAIYWHPSSRIDYGIFLVNVVLSPLILAGAGWQTYLSIEIGNGLVALNDGRAVFVGNWSVSTYLLFVVGFTLAADFAVYVVHRVHHASPVLWPIHALHHSAEVMTPVTLFRKHPLWNVAAYMAHLTLTGAFQGAFIFVFYGVPDTEVLFGLNTIYVLYNVFGANLRHSHVWLSFGRTLSHVFISPAMHQIHHDPNRMNRNYGEMLAIWDWMFGTLYVPKRRETFSIGLGSGRANPHATLAKAYWLPLVEVAEALRARFRPRAVE